MTSVHFRQSLAPKSEHLAGGRAGGNFQHGAAFKRRHLDIAAEGRAGKADRHATEKVHAFALENIVRLDMQDNVEIARRTTPRTALALAGGTESRAILDAGGNLDLDLRGLLHAPVAMTGMAWLFDGLARAATTGTSLSNVEKAARNRYLAMAAAGRAGRDLAARLGPGTVTSVAGLEFRDFDLLLHATRCFLESDLHVVAQISSATASAPLRAVLAPDIAKDALENSTAAAPSGAEDLAENVKGIVRSAARAAGEAAPLGKRLVAVAVVGRAFVDITQHFVGLAQFLELVLGRFIAGIFVGMVLHCQLAVGLLDVLRAGISLHTQDVIIIAFRRRHLMLLSLFAFGWFGHENGGGPQ
jgi:hypothetical protein